MEGLDLSSWISAFNGAEPIHPETLENFYHHFKSVGFKLSSFVPSFGMAETTLMITGSPVVKEPLMKYFNADKLETNMVEPSTPEAKNAKKLVASGAIIADIPVKIVDPHTKNTCNHNQIGEIWVQGPSVASGYWNRPEESEETFNAYTSDTNEGPFLRTGDLGFLHEGELFVTCRIKDLIIIDGSNHYPQDIERSADASHEAIVPYGTAAFSVRERNSEKLIIMVELDRRKMRTLENTTEKYVTKAIRAQVSHDHDLRVYDVYYVPKRLPKTTSGKVQRHMCRKIYLESKNEVLT
jgi:acyl-CoA synthetase (AMP-forming)/AMP-acid ligase II